MITELHDEGGALRGLGKVVRDITDQRAAEAAVDRREQHLRSILETVLDAMIIIDELGFISSFSAAAERIFGYKRGVAGPKCPDAYARVRNRLDRFHLMADVIERASRLSARAAHAQQAIRDKLIEHEQYICEHGQDMPEILDWRWQRDTH